MAPIFYEILCVSVFTMFLGIIFFRVIVLKHGRPSLKISDRIRLRLQSEEMIKIDYGQSHVCSKERKYSVKRVAERRGVQRTTFHR